MIINVVYFFLIVHFLLQVILLVVQFCSVFSLFGLLHQLLALLFGPRLFENGRVEVVVLLLDSVEVDDVLGA